MVRVTSDEINQAKQVRIIDFLDANHIDAKQEGRRGEPYYRLADHDSLVIKGEKFFWNSRQEGGYGVISFAMTYYDLKFPEAVKRVNEHEYAPVKHREEARANEPFRYPAHYEVKDTKKIEDYLVNERKIDPRVVEWCIKKDLLVQDRKGNAVFKWKDQEGKVNGADRQGTAPMDNGGYFKGMVAKSKEDGGFTIDVGKNPKKIAVFESPIDMLSYWSVHKKKVQDTRMVSMGGVKIESVNRAVMDLRSQGHKVEAIVSAVDNDKAGNQFHQKLKDHYGEKRVIDDRPKDVKDWNDVRKQRTAAPKRQPESQMGM
ncbi:DUF3991 and toprim domain-containing protein [Alkalicoccus luteus]|uniref:DUF3991 domain-containing protein n=1 Tax=Alkalicoccus luteus TaxID=1237094 RepID=A0A969TWA6_9BACI|nr:DUF3991 and toprim domain-containing protein [Alkalicoccus luteus]NJP38992.1 DUF3991 domain-containing protein [Alkalicoccus luteus]